MIRMLVKLALVALVANATWHLFGVYAPNYRFKDAVQSATLFRGDISDDALHDKVLALAEQFDLPLMPEDVTVTHDGSRTLVDVSYVTTVELAPGFRRPWPLSFHLDVLTNAPTRATP